MDAITISRRIANLTGLDRARAFQSLATDVHDVIATGTLDTSALLTHVNLYNWLTDMAARAAREG